jgi:hypothetical protein
LPCFLLPLTKFSYLFIFEHSSTILTSKTLFLKGEPRWKRQGVIL